MAPQVGLEPTTLRLTVARTGKLPIAGNCDVRSKIAAAVMFLERLSTGIFERGSLKKSPKYFGSLRRRFASEEPGGQKPFRFRFHSGTTGWLSRYSLRPIAPQKFLTRDVSRPHVAR